MRRAPVWSGILLLIICASAAGYYFLYPGRTRHPETNAGSQPVAANPIPALIGKVRPDFSLPDLNGRVRSASDWDGRVIALNFWASWCAPCVQEIPEFVALQKKYAKQGLQVVGVAIQNADQITGFVRQHGINYPILVGGMAAVRLAEKLGDYTGTLPYTVIIDRNKRIHFIHNGRLQDKQVEQAIKPLL